MQFDESALLVSLRPRFAQLLLDGTKTVELRRVRPSVRPGTLVVMYESSPSRQLVGTGRVKRVHVASVDKIWEEFGPLTGIGRAEYDAYFDGLGDAVAIVMCEVKRLTKPRPLAELRTRWVGFRPPQSYRYLDSSQIAAMGVS